MPLPLRATVLAALATLPLLASAQTRCAALVRALGARLADVECLESPDLTTQNPATTPANNSLPGLPALAFTPVTDRGVITAHGPYAGPPVPGVELRARFADDPLGEGRFLLRLPDAWNGRLVVAGASGTRSEFNGDLAWSDYVLPKGFAYASQNKGVLNLRLTTAADPLACRLNPDSPLLVRFYDDEPAAGFGRWRDFMVLAGRTARRGVQAHYGHEPARTYAVGTSNGGYQVRRAVETAPQLFDGGVDWEGTFVDAVAQNLLTDLPPAVLNFRDYKAGGLAEGTAARNIRAAGYPPDLVAGTTSLWGLHDAAFWEVTLCQWQKRFDPSYPTYGAGPVAGDVSSTGTYNYVARLSTTDPGTPLAAVATDGRIRRPLVTVAGTLDALLPIDHHARAYARRVAAARGDGDDGRRAPAYRLYEVQNGNHIETYRSVFPQLELIEPHAHRAFDLLVDHVETGAALPPDQCIPRGGAIAAGPAEPGHCADLYVP